MANIHKRVRENLEGEFFVDTTCIDCDACRQLAPETFEDTGEFSFVYHQPETDGERRNAMRALLACPVGSIGTAHPNNAREVMQDFPMRLNPDAPEKVYYCGFNSPDSYGGNSYFIQHPDGNWLIDSPRFIPHLVSQFEALGGLRYIFLTHRDDVADADRYAEKFGAQRIIHREELSAQPDAEIVFEGVEPVRFAEEFRLIPTPGHTKGHSVLLYKHQYLFTGDHLWWNRETRDLGASRSYCWYSWEAQKESMVRLAEETFEWVLPGHGDRMRLDKSDMKRAMTALLKKMNVV